MSIDIRNREICTIDDVLATFKQSTEASRHFSDKTQAFLEAQGIFPLTYSNPKLAPLNVLGMLVYITGNIRRRRNQFYAIISCSGNHAEESFLSLERALNVSISPTAHAFALGCDGAQYARLLVAMGYPATSGTKEHRESKANVGTVIPKYLTRLFDEWGDLTARSRGLCLKYIRDFLSVWIDTKGSYHSGEFALDTLSQPNKKLVHKQIAHIKRAFECAYGGIVKPQDWPQKFYQSGRKLPCGQIKIPADQLRIIAEKTSLPLRITVEKMTPRYSF